MAASSKNTRRNYTKLLQEIYHPNVWKIFVCCIMLNLTTGTQVHKIIKDVFRKYPNPKRMSEADPVELTKMIQTCGLANKRALTLIKMSQEYRKKQWQEPKDLHGLGQYAQDSYDIFVRGRRDVNPTDKILKRYLNK